METRSQGSFKVLRNFIYCWMGVLQFVAASAADMQIAPGTDVIFGAFVPGQQPDGNSILIHAPDGLIVIDTGRHVAHTQKIIDLASQAKLPIAAIINSHWHLDHIGGDSRIRAAYPKVQIYASDALKGAMGDFLARYREYLDKDIQSSPDDPKTQSSRDELAIIENAQSALPTVAISKTARLVVAGRALVLHLEPYSVTAGDVWVFDPATRVLAAGDLVTLPVPFLDTACPQHWKRALQHLADSDFKTLVPGHGAVMHRAEFDRYHRAYDNLLRCAGGAAPKPQCIDGWMRDAGELIEEKDRSYSKLMLDSYLDSSLRAAPASIAKLCGN